MAVSLSLDGYSGASIGRTADITSVNLTSSDGFTTSAANSPVPRNGRSYIKHVGGRLHGSWTSLLGAFAYRNNSASGDLTNCVIFGNATLQYQGPTNGALSGGTVLAGMSAGTTNGPNPTLELKFGPSAAGATLSAASNNLTPSAAFTGFLRLQLLVGPSAGPPTYSSSVPSSSWVIAVNEN